MYHLNSTILLAINSQKHRTSTVSKGQFGSSLALEKSLSNTVMNFKTMHSICDKELYSGDHFGGKLS